MHEKVGGGQKALFDPALEKVGVNWPPWPRASTVLPERLDVALHESNWPNSCNRLNNWLSVCIHDTTGCQTGCSTALTTGCIV